MPMKGFGKQFEDFTAVLEARGFRATNHHTFTVPQGKLVLFGLVRTDPDVRSAESSSFVARFYPDGSFETWSQAPELSWDIVAERMIEGPIPRRIADTLADALDEHETEFEGKREAFDDYSEEDVERFKGRLTEARAFIRK